MEFYSAQIERIKSKLKQAREADKSLAVFGADQHRYIVGPPVSEQQVWAFEAAYGLELPLAYKLFVTQVGNGGKSYRESAAGPYYGIYKFGEEVDDIIDDPQHYLARPATLFPGLTAEHWTALTAAIEADDCSDEVFAEQINILYQGLLPIGSQGCTYVTALVVSGEHKGRVVYLDQDRYLPRFAFEANFLDWYERWLDEVIRGYLQQDGPSWFGYSRAGTEDELMAQYQATTDEELRLEYLNGFFKLPTIHTGAQDFLAAESENPNEPIRTMALQLLTKYAYASAKSRLKEEFQRMPLPVLKYVHWYAKSYALDWQPELQALFASGIQDPDLFYFATYVLRNGPSNVEQLLLPYTTHPNETIRKSAVYTLNQHGYKWPL
ncbi:SMI1/KNR4 family protein [Hymenobacter cellulosivorans]|uniref:SMI1/KNR4 family protein n=1 Tax=Hymenobacter cellulosivorans TaxID=2932249 RepID=A0ABY4F3P9_9BACT|nr:SMI1/KNR4 family protein [Hymenobacter cellulosivorans]UOQ51276.1 SMI1/KNR4 family protein [Hymenobacter cellulosivorans]